MLTSDNIRQGASQQSVKATRDELPKVRDAKKKLDDMGLAFFESDIVLVLRELGLSASIDAIVNEVMNRAYLSIFEFFAFGAWTLNFTEDGHHT